MDLLLMNAHRYVPNYLPGSNLGMNILLQLARRKGYDAEMCQTYAGKILKELDERSERKTLPKVIGFYTDFNNITWTEKIIRHLKLLSHEVLVIVGGPQCVGLGESFLRSSGADFLCPGEGEESLMELLECVLRNRGSLEEIRGIAYIKDDVYHFTPQRVASKDLDSIPWPDFNLCDDYHSVIMPILTGRGCPMGCTFCYEGANARNVRYASAESVLAEIEKRVEADPSLCYVNFLDDTFTLNRRRVEAICDGLTELRKKRDFVWFCSAHIDTVHRSPGLIRKMTDSGMCKLFFGLESGNDEMLQRYHKHTDRQMIIDTIGQCIQEGAKQISGNFILGGPFETPQTVEDSMSLVDELLKIAPGRFDTSFFTFLPYPNTPITNNPEQFGVRLHPEYIDCCLEDIPLSETAEIDYDAMMSLRLMTNYRLQKKMRDMYEHNAVPEAAILEIFRMANRYHVYSKWTEYVYSHYPVDDAYWHMRACEGFRKLSELKNPDEAYVKRSISIWDEYDTANGTLADIHVKPSEVTALMLCNGKLRRGEVLTRCVESGMERTEAEALLGRFEERKWIAYTEL